MFGRKPTKSGVIRQAIKVAQQNKPLPNLQNADSATRQAAEAAHAAELRRQEQARLNADKRSK